MAIKTKKEFKILLTQINFDILFESIEINDKYNLKYKKYIENTECLAYNGYL